MDKNLEKFLEPTELIDWKHPLILEKSNALFTAKESDSAKAEVIFYFIREIPYAFDISFNAKDYKASAILQANRGFCTQKAILFCALARSAGIPAGIHFHDIVDHTLSDHFLKFLKTDVLVYHGIASLFISGAWRQYDATIDSRLADRKGMQPVSFSPDHDCLMPPKDLEGGPNIDYVKDRGRHADVSFQDIETFYRQAYSHLSKLDLDAFMVDREERIKEKKRQ